MGTMTALFEQSDAASNVPGHVDGQWIECSVAWVRTGTGSLHFRIHAYHVATPVNRPRNCKQKNTRNVVGKTPLRHAAK